MKTQFVIENIVEKARELISAGYKPVEYSHGGQSIVDEDRIDHHGELSHLESVALRGYRDLYGTAKNVPGFVGCGVADADMCFCVAALLGIIPHPDRDLTDRGHLPPPVKAALTRDLMSLVETIAMVDVNPIGLNVSTMPGGDYLLLWNAMTTNARDSLGFAMGVGLWRSMLDANPAQIGPMLEATRISECNRIAASLLDLTERGETYGKVMVIKGSRVWGFNEWYGRNLDHSGETPEGWKHPVVVAWLENSRTVTMGCPNQAVSEALFGSGGLKNVFPHLPKIDGEMWGGRESVGGGPVVRS